MSEKSVVFLLLFFALIATGATVLLLNSDDPGQDRDRAPRPGGAAVEEGVENDAPEPEDEISDNTVPDKNRDKVRIDTPDRGEGKSTLRGRVVGTDGRPLAGATVALFRLVPDLFVSRKSKTGLKARTGPDGAYRLDRVPAGVNLLLECSAPGYAVLEEPHPPVEPGAEKRVPDLTMTSGMQLTGTVKDKSGRPVASAVIRAVSRSIAAGAGNKNAASCRTDAEGHYRLDFLAAGSHEISIEAEGFLPHTRSVLFGFLGNLEDKSTLDFVLIEAAGSLKGIVLSHKGKPLANAVVQAALAGAATSSSVSKECRTAKNGAFTLNGISSGLYVVTAEHESYFLKEPIQVQSTADRVKVLLHEKGRVKGRIISEGAPPGRFDIGIEKFVPKWPRTRLSREREYRFSRGRSFTLAGLIPGTYVFVVKADGFAWSLSPEIEVSSGKTAENLEITLVLGGGLKGQLFDPHGRPISGAAIRLLHKHHFPGLQFGFELGVKPEQGKTCTTGSNGSFLLETIVPGEYSLEIVAAGKASRLINKVTVEREVVRDLGSVTLSVGGSILGNALDKNGLAAKGKRVVAMDTQSGIFKSAVTDDTGFFQIKGLAAGQYLVYLDDKSGAMSNLRTDVTIRVHDNESVRVDLVPRKAGDK